MTQVSMTVVMPALNEEANIEASVVDTLEAFDRLKIAGEILVIDDGSTDATGALVRKIMEREPRVRLIRHERPWGVGGSFWDGVAQAHGEFLCFLPGDHENDPEEIFQYFSLLRDVDFVVPFVFNRGVRPRFRVAVSSLFRFIVNTSLRVNFNYTNGTVMYRRKLLEELTYHSKSFLFTTDILVRLNRRGYLYAEVPYRLQQRSKRPSKALSLRSLSAVSREFLRLWWDVYFRSATPRPFAGGSATARRCDPLATSPARNTSVVAKA